MTINDIITDLCQFLPKEELDYLKSFDKTKLITLHSSFGRNIRNKYNLWYKELDDEEFKGAHPDDVSQRIIERMWEKLQ